MDINIKIVSAFDSKKNNAAYFYVAELKDEISGQTKVLKTKDNVLSVSDKLRARSIVSNELQQFVRELKSEYNITSVDICGHEKCMERYWFEKK